MELNDSENSDEAMSPIQYINDVMFSSDSEDSSSSMKLPKCLICKKDELTNPTLVNRCKHEFCFNCIFVWYKEKHTCPNCEITIISLIYDIVSIDEYSECSFVFRAHNTQDVQIITTKWKAPDLRYKGLTKSNTNISKSIYDLFLHDSVAIERFSDEHGQDDIPARMNVMRWREYIYQTKMYAIPLYSVGERRRECNAKFLKNNPIQMDRLFTWLNRELCAILGEKSKVFHRVIRRIRFLLRKYNIKSKAFLRGLRTIGLAFAKHLLHELYNFAIAPFDMITYDECVVYKPYFKERNENISTSRSSMLPADLFIAADIKSEWTDCVKRFSNVEMLENGITNNDNNKLNPIPIIGVDKATAAEDESFDKDLTVIERTLYSIILSDDEEDEPKPPPVKKPVSVPKTPTRLR